MPPSSQPQSLSPRPVLPDLFRPSGLCQPAPYCLSPGQGLGSGHTLCGQVSPTRPDLRPPAPRGRSQASLWVSGAPWPPPRPPLTLQVGHGDVGMDAIDGSTGLEAPIPARLVMPLTLVRGVVVVAEYGWGEGSASGGAKARVGGDAPAWPLRGDTWPGARDNVRPVSSVGRESRPPAGQPQHRDRWALTAQVWRPPEHTGPLLCTLLGVGGHSGAEALTVPAGVTGAGVMDAGLVEGLGVHLGEKTLPQAHTATRGQTCPGAKELGTPRTRAPSPSTSLPGKPGGDRGPETGGLPSTPPTTAWSHGPLGLRGLCVLSSSLEGTGGAASWGSRGRWDLRPKDRRCS